MNDITKTEINIKNLKKQSGLLNQFKIMDIIIDCFNTSEIPFFQFHTSMEVELEGEKFITVGILLKEDTVEKLSKGLFNFYVQLGVDNKEENTIEHGPVLEISLKISDILKIDSGKWNKEVSFVNLEVVLLLNKLYCVSRVNTLRKRYLSLNPSVI